MVIPARNQGSSTCRNGSFLSDAMEVELGSIALGHGRCNYPAPAPVDVEPRCVAIRPV